MTADDALRDAAYAMCKKVLGASQRDEIKATIDELNHVPPEQHDPTAGHLGYAARRQHAQFYGYLVVDDYRDAGEQLAIEPLTAHQRRTLTRGHASVLYLNQACAAPVLDAAPAAAAAIDPYARLRSLQLPVQPAATLVKDDTVLEISNAFAKTRAVRAVLDTASELRDKLSSNQCLAMVSKLVDDIEGSGAMSCPRDLSNLLRRELRASTPQAAVARYCLALTCIRGMLQSLDQLLYQSTLRPRITSLDGDSVFALRGPYRHDVGTGYSAGCQPTQDQLRIEPGDVVFLAVDLEGHPNKATCFITNMVIEFNQEFGMKMRLDMRELDEELNPYAGLL